MEYILMIPMPYRNFVVLTVIILVALTLMKVMFHLLDQDVP